ncbi:MAG: hypothetical protein ABIZ05_09110 [Pseudonocardiaceae bacterium]
MATTRPASAAAVTAVMMSWSSLPRPVNAAVSAGKVHVAGEGGAGGRWMFTWSPATWLKVLVSWEVPLIWTGASPGVSSAGGIGGAVVMVGN